VAHSRSIREDPCARMGSQFTRRSTGIFPVGNEQKKGIQAVAESDVTFRDLEILPYPRAVLFKTQGMNTHSQLDNRFG